MNAQQPAEKPVTVNPVPEIVIIDLIKERDALVQRVDQLLQICVLNAETIRDMQREK